MRRGQVELYSNYGSSDQELLYKDSNIIVDGAGELIADLMTYPTPSLGAISELSSILDASNYTVQAISFGKAAPNFSKHAHFYPSSLSNSATILSFTASGNRIVVVPYTTTDQSHYPTSAYPGGPYLPSYPAPQDEVLEANSIPMAASALYDTFSKLGVDWGQNLNMLPYRDSIDLSTLSFNAMPLAAASASYELDVTNTVLGASAIWLGCYPESSGVSPVASAFMVSSWDGITGADAIPGSIITSGTLTSGIINSVSSMDILGYLGRHYCVSGNIAPVGSTLASGLIVSAGHDTDGSSVTYMTTLGAGDVQCANFYGGITTAGLWSLDICKSMEESKLKPPLHFNPINNPRRYKLFSKKVFNQNICQIPSTQYSLKGVGGLDSGHLPLTFIWRLYF